MRANASDSWAISRVPGWAMGATADAPSPMARVWAMRARTGRATNAAASSATSEITASSTSAVTKSV